MIVDAGLLVVANLLFLAAGAGVTALAGWWQGLRGLGGSLGISYLVGVAAFGVVAQVLYVVGASLSRVEVVAVCGILALGTLRGLRLPGGLSPKAPPVWVLLAPALFLALLALDLWYQPLWSFDSWTFWTPRAYGLFALDGLDTNWFTSAEMLGGARRDYPLLLPAVEAAGFRFMGYEPRLLDIQSWIFLVGFVVAIIQVSAGRARNIVLGAVLLMLVAAPATAAQLANAEADIPLAILFATAGTCAVLWLESRESRTLVLATVLACGAAATKIEGPIFVGAMFAALTVCAWRVSRRDSLKALGAFAVAIALGVAPWRIWVHVYGGAPTGAAPSLSPSTLLDQVSYIPQAAVYLTVKVLDPLGWLLIVPLWAAATWVAWRRGHRLPVAFTVATIGIAFAGLVISYWSTPIDLHHHLATSARRVVTSIVFLCAALTPLLAGDEPCPDSETIR
jgi:4-amino-4-deoxy-L-arabinose transferase-like glycosyltransferase